MVSDRRIVAFVGGLVGALILGIGAVFAVEPLYLIIYHAVRETEWGPFMIIGDRGIRTIFGFFASAFLAGTGLTVLLHSRTIIEE